MFSSTKRVMQARLLTVYENIVMGKRESMWDDYGSVASLDL